MTDDLPVIETSCAEETIAVLLGEVARHSPARALRILIEHLGMEEVRAAAIAEREFEDGDEAPSAEEAAAAADEHDLDRALTPPWKRSTP